MMVVVAVVAAVVVLTVWFELREWRHPRSSGAKGVGPDELRRHIAADVDLGHSYRDIFRQGDHRRGD